MIKNICKTCKIIFTKSHNVNRVYKFCSCSCANKNLDRIKKHSGMMKGRVSWNKGKHLSKAHRKKISESALGRVGSVPWNKGKPNLQGRGDKHYNWKGGITPINKAIRNSLAYEEWRTKIFKRDNYICQICLKVGGKLNADHIKPFSLFPELRLELTNGRTLCEDCHRKTKSYLNSHMERKDFISINVV